MQINLFGEEKPTSEVPYLHCTGEPDCPAPADAHRDDCAKEQALREEFGY